ncbi:hypothetical protein C2S52_012542 [Perilla frutescens var. hirtella]|nr:hypothetical protein C2S52_012542 [Perilla frutescens var. hirtella]
MAEALLQVLVEKLSSQIQNKIGLILGVEKEMKKLQSTLTTIQSVLEDAESIQFRDKQIQNWLSKLNAAAFELEDILDECATELSKLDRGDIKLKYLKKILSSYKIGRSIKEMAERLDDLASERRNFHLREIVAPPSSSIDCGLFNDQRVSQHFDTKLWVCVSDNFDCKILLEAMIVSATKKASGLEQLDALQCRLRELLSQKRYLLILDDVWNHNQEDWAKLKGILECGSKGASIVVTTRLRKVADIMGTLPFHSLKGLSEEDLWSLFKLRAFGREKEIHDNLETIGRQIVKKCGGVPLAAKALGGLLRFKRNENEWIHVRESELWVLGEEEDIMPALRLSYHHLPSELRRCFTYCAVFPKDSVMKKRDLIFRWMAHGCISSNGGREVEDIGDKIWNELVVRSIFEQVSGEGIDTTFKMHDLAHSIMENKVQGTQMKSSSKVREVHFGMHSGDCCLSISLKVATLSTINDYTRLRILKLNSLSVKNLPIATGKSKHLRYLDLSRSDICSLPRTFCRLWNLQILNLSGCYSLKSLPKHIIYMTNLRHIILEGCDSLSEMPSGIGKLGGDELPERWFGGLKSLKKLEICRCKIGRSVLEGWLRHIRSSLEELIISNCSELDSLPEEIIHLHLLKRLNLVVSLPQGFGFGLQHLQSLELIALPKLTSLPEWLGNLTSLTHLGIHLCPMLTSLPSTIQGMSNLKVLGIGYCRELEKRCEKEKGEDWHKIAHIPHLLIGN